MSESTREKVRTLFYDWDIDDFLDGELDPLLDSIEEVYARGSDA